LKRIYMGLKLRTQLDTAGPWRNAEIYSSIQQPVIQIR
jgi:hypothetical protein